MNIIALVTHLKLVAQEAKKYAAGLASELSNATLEAMQETVGGYIEEYMPFDDEVAIVCNEEGKMNGAELNRAIYSNDKEILDIIAGKFFIAYAPIESESFLSMPKDLMKKYEDKFRYPERFYQTDKGIEAKAYKPISKDMER